LKAQDTDPSASLEVCRALGAEDRGTIAQRDTYFKVARGGLKLREEQPGRPHLIQFERASEPQQRESLTVLSRIRAMNPTVSMQNVRYVGCEKHGASRDSKPASELGT
jgi:hypothetical protein